MKTQNDTFKEVLNSYPSPIALIVSKYLKISSDKLNDRHSVLCDLFESFVKLVAIIAIKEGLIIDKKIKQRFPSGLDFLKHPALGHWVSIIRAFGADDYEYQDSFLYQISNWYKSERPSQEILEPLNALPEVNFPKGLSAVAGIIDCLVTYRNKVWKGHGAVIVNEKSLDERVTSLEQLMHFLLLKADFLKEINIFYTQEVKKISDNTYQANATSLMGIDGSSANFVFTSFELQEIYAAYSMSKSLAKGPISLSPLIEYKKNEKDESQIYFFNDAKKSKLEYLSYFDGSFYYHKEINKELQEVFNIRLEKGYETEDFFISSLPEEERRTKSTYFLEKGMELHKKGNFEGAIIAFEDALEWYRNVDAIVLMCKSMLANEEDKIYVLNILESAFEMDPNNPKAKDLKERIINDDFIDSEPIEYLSYFDIIIPDQFRAYPLITYSLILFLIYGVCAVTLTVLDGENAFTHIIFSALCFIQSIVLYLGLSSAKNNFIDSYFPLLRQQAHMSTDKFKKWYDESFRNIFGHFEMVTKSKRNNFLFFRKLSWSWRPNKIKEKLFIVFFFLFIFWFSITQINIQVLYKKPFLVAAIRFFETSLMWMFLPPILRYFFVSTFFLNDYSKKELKPVVSSFHSNGFTALNKIFINSLVTFVFFYISVLIAYLIVSKDPFYGDVLGVAFGLFVGSFWLIYTPLYINRSLNFSKSITLSDYNDHINKAFDKFIKNPEKNNLERIQWLKSNENVVSSVSTKLFSFKHWIIYIVFLIVFLASSLLYLLIRFNYISISLLSFP